MSRYIYIYIFFVTKRNLSFFILFYGMLLQKYFESERRWEEGKTGDIFEQIGFLSFILSPTWLLSISTRSTSFLTLTLLLLHQTLIHSRISIPSVQKSINEEAVAEPVGSLCCLRTLILEFSSPIAGHATDKCSRLTILMTMRGMRMEIGSSM